METQAMLSEFDRTTQALLEQLWSFTEKQMNVVPPQGGWTAAQVVDHLLQAGSGLPQLFAGNVEDTIRQPDEKLPSIRAIFLDFTTKLQAPEFILPRHTEYDKAILVRDVESMMANIRNAAATSPDLTKTCMDFPVPVLGTLTQLEWVHFVMYHTQRHTNQLRNIFEATA